MEEPGPVNMAHPLDIADQACTFYPDRSWRKSLIYMSRTLSFVLDDFLSALRPTGYRISENNTSSEAATIAHLAWLKATMRNAIAERYEPPKV